MKKGISFKLCWDWTSRGSDYPAMAENKEKIEII